MNDELVSWRYLDINLHVSIHKITLKNLNKDFKSYTKVPLTMVLGTGAGCTVPT